MKQKTEVLDLLIDERIKKEDILATIENASKKAFEL